MIGLNLLIGVFLLLWLYFLWSRRRFYLLFMKMRGPLGYPLIGMAFNLMNKEDILPQFLKAEKQYGRSFVSWLGPYPFLNIAEPELAETILTSADFVDKSFIYSAMGYASGSGLFTLRNPLWSIHRRLINPSFSHKVLMSFIPIFNREVNSLTKDLDELVGVGAVDLSILLQAFTLNIAAQTTMGKPMASMKDKNMDLLPHIKRVLSTMTQIMFSPWLASKFLFRMSANYRPYVKSKQRMRDFIQTLIREKMAEMEPNINEPSNTEEDVDIKKNPNIFIDRAIQLLQNGDFTWKDVESESNVIVFGAFETTSNTIGNTILALAMFPKYQDKLFEEISSIVASGDVDVTYKDTLQMTYMDMVLNETMRVMSPIPLIAREAMRDFTLPNGVVLPKGCQVSIDIFNMQRDEKYWGAESTVFNPDNFLPSNMTGQRYALLSMKIILSKLVRKYRFSTKFEFKNLEFVEEITLKLKNYPLVEIHLRET